MTEGDWPSAACWNLFMWLQGLDVPTLVPVHLRRTLEDRGHQAIVSTRDCAFDTDLAYSWLGLSRTHEAYNDFFISSCHNNQGGSYWGFGLKSGDVVTFIQVTSDRIGRLFNDRFTPDVRPFELFIDLLWPHINEQSLFDRPLASVAFSDFRGREATVWTPEPDDPSQPVGAQRPDLDMRAYAARKVEAVQRFAAELNALTRSPAR